MSFFITIRYHIFILAGFLGTAVAVQIDYQESACSVTMRTFLPYSAKPALKLVRGKLWNSSAGNLNELILGGIMAAQSIVSVFLNNLVGFSFKEKRKYDRRRYGANAILIVHDREYSCLVENISNTGALLNIDLPHPIRLGQLVEVQIPFSDGESYVEKSAKIKRIEDNHIAIQFLW